MSKITPKALCEYPQISRKKTFVGSIQDEKRGKVEYEGLIKVKKDQRTSVIHPKIFAWKQMWFSEIYMRP